MKKIILITLVMSICLFLVSCSASNSAGSNSTGSVEPPHRLYFDSFEKIAELKDILSKDESEVYEYLKENNYHMNRLSSKSDIYNFFNSVGNLNMLHLDSSSGYYLSTVQYSWDMKKLLFAYKNKDKKIEIYCYVDSEGTVASKFAESTQEFEVADKMDFGGEELILYHRSGESKISFRSCITTSNSLIDVWFYDDDKTAVKEVIEKYAISTTLNELIAQ